MFRRDRVDRAFARYCQSGEPQALAEVFDLTAKELLRVALWLCGNRADAEDLLQRTFLSAIEGRARFDAGQRVLPWLCGIVVNHARSLQRDRARRQREGAGVVDAVRDPAEVVADRELQQRLQLLRDELVSPYREVLELHLEHGMNAKQIAARLGRPAGTVRTQLVRALELLRRRLPGGFVAGLAPLLPDAAVLAKVKVAVVAAAQGAVPVSVAGASVVTAVAGGVVMANKLLVVAPLVAVVLGVGVYLAMPEAPVAIRRQATATPALVAAATGRPSGEREAVQRSVVSPPSLHVVDDRSGQPIATARLLRVEANSRGFEPDRAPDLANADTSGAIDCPVPFDHADKVVFAPDYVPALAPILTDGVAVLRLHRGLSLSVRATDEADMPVAGVEVMLAGSGPGSHERLPAALRIGNPASDDRVWTASTDDRGVAVFSGLPDAPLRLFAWHDTLSPLSRLGVGDELVQPPAAVEVRMGPLYGVCAQLPVLPELLDVSWQIDPSCLDRTLPVLMRAGEATRRLEVRFPGSHAFVARPGSLYPDTALKVPCQGIGKDGSVWSATARLMPLAEVQPVPLQLQPGLQSSLVQIDVFDSNGTPLPMPLDLWEKERRQSLHVDSGAPAWLPDGSYRIGLPLGSWFHAVAAESLSIHVGGGEPAGGHFAVRLPMRLAKLVLAAKLPAEDDRKTVIHISIQGGENNVGLANRYPHDSPWTVWVPYSTFKVRVDSACYAHTPQQVVVDRPEVQLDLQLRRRTAGEAQGPESRPGPTIPDRSR